MRLALTLLLLLAGAQAQMMENIVTAKPPASGGSNVVTKAQAPAFGLHNGGGATTVTASLSGVTVGNTIWLWAASQDSTSCFPTIAVSDTTNTYTQLGTTTHNLDRSITSGQWSAPVTTGGSLTFTATYSGCTPNGVLGIIAYELTGSVSQPVNDSHNVGQSAGTSTTSTNNVCAALTVAGTSDAVLSANITSSTNNTWTAGSGFTKDGCVAVAGSCTGSTIGASESQTGVSSGLTPTITATTASFWTNQCAAFK